MNVGEKHNQLKVLGITEVELWNKKTKVAEVECDCGKTFTTSLGSLNRLISCGCHKKEAKVTRSDMKTKEYSAWSAMFDKGTVCAEWESFNKFIADMGKAPKIGYLIRKDEKIPFCKSNCEWKVLK